MSRSYAAVPHDYLEEMELLSDAEFGRLIRALLVYSRTGETSELSGSERVLFPRVKLQEDRFQESYNASIEKKREAGKKSADARANRKKQHSPEANTVEQRSTEANTVEQRSTEANTVEQRSTEANNNKTKSNTIPPDANASRGSKKRQSRFKAPTREEVAAYCSERGNSVDPDRFIDYYAAQGWKLSNGVKMTNWKAAVRNWERLESRDTHGGQCSNRGSPTDVYMQIAQEEGCL